ncbi:NAD(P)/FAD-dependent oxidoreductase [Rhodospirillales bacterium]|nr:NAD(P)/FAD-dependent oxidoreductase [Rhodospirillales bacterium]
MQQFDVIIIGAGAAGLMCAGEVCKRGRRVLMIDHAKKIGEKIRISGGGRANFTNLHASPANFLSNNPYFCISALKRYTQFDFIDLVEKYKIDYHERSHGQLFCKGSAQQITQMLLSEARGAKIQTETSVKNITKVNNIFYIETNKEKLSTSSLVVATGGPSIPKMGATGFGYDIAKQFGLNVIPPRAALVPLTLSTNNLEKLDGLAGVSLLAIVNHGKVNFREGLVFTHKGLSGPAILQISSYWREGDNILINLLPEIDVFSLLKLEKNKGSKKEIRKIISTLLPNRLAQRIVYLAGCDGNLAETPDKELKNLGNTINEWILEPSGTEGMRTAEVTIGGVDTKNLSSRTMEANNVTGLYFIGEAVDVTGHLGGFNFQWAWSSGYACGQVA